MRFSPIVASRELVRDCGAVFFFFFFYKTFGLHSTRTRSSYPGLRPRAARSRTVLADQDAPYLTLKGRPSMLDTLPGAAEISSLLQNIRLFEFHTISFFVFVFL